MRMRSTAVVAVGLMALAGLTACSSSSGGSGGSSSGGGGGGGASCSKESIQAALPNGSNVTDFSCADVSGTTWAAAKVSEGNTVFFLKKSGDKWDVSDSGSICGAASAGLPEKILSYCENTQ